jgi:hypothetical protein
MGFFDEPRYILNNICNEFYDMPINTIREQTFCCGVGSGLNTDEIMDLRMRGGLPRANAVKYVHEKHGVNLLSCICAIDRATLPPMMEYWVPDVEVSGVHELLANALILEGETKRTMNLRAEEFPWVEEEEVEEVEEAAAEVILEAAEETAEERAEEVAADAAEEVAADAAEETAEETVKEAAEGEAEVEK